MNVGKPIACLAAVLFLTTSFARAADRAPGRLLAADSSKNHIALFDVDGKMIWQRKIGDLHDLHLLPGGNILFQDSWTHLLEVAPGIGDGATDKIVWEYDAARMNGNG